MIKSSTAVSQGYDVAWKLVLAKLSNFYFAIRRNPDGNPAGHPFGARVAATMEGTAETDESKHNNKENST